MQKSGFTLVEVMTVVVAIGILSAIGVSSLQQAIINTRVKDAARNTAAFLERTANEANRMSATLCLSKVSDQRINVYKSSDDCENVDSENGPLFYFEIEAPMLFTACPAFSETDLCDGDDGCDTDWLGDGNGVFKPRLGLSAAPMGGHVCARYGEVKDGNSYFYAAALKRKSENTIKAIFGYSGEMDEL